MSRRLGEETDMTMLLVNMKCSLLGFRRPGLVF